MKNLLGGWQISGATFMRTGTPFSVAADRPTTSPASATAASASPTTWSATTATELPAVRRHAGNGGVQHGRLRARRPTARSATRRATACYNPGEQQWDLALFKNFSVGGTRALQFRAEIFNFLNHPNLGGIEANPLSANFGRITAKDGNSPRPQLSGASRSGSSLAAADRTPPDLVA